MSQQDHRSFRPAWYQQEMDRLVDQQVDCPETWSHPTDMLFLVAAVALLTGIFIGRFG
jgi:hypothetical protein